MNTNTNNIQLIDKMLLGARVVGFGGITFNEDEREIIIAVTSNAEGEIIIHTIDNDFNVHIRNLAGCKLKF